MCVVCEYLWKTTAPALKPMAAVIFFFCIPPHFLKSQTTNISGIINTYHSVVEVIPAKAGVRVDNVGTLDHGDLVVLVQMKGASIQTTNNSGFGDTISLNNAGNYELATVCEVVADTVFFFHTLLNNYTAADKVQLVKFGEYYSANVIDTVKAASWDSASGKGGVLAIRVEEDLTLNAPLFADSTGYGGGAYYQHSGTCGFLNPVGTGYAYDATSASSQNGAYKGEGVAQVPSNLDGARGAPANGGGGGNNHNNGGGGGSNLSSGGDGGGNYSTGPTGCTGNLHGSGGRSLSSWGAIKIFMGGGGGAGHSNNTVQPYAGGNGGGLVFIIAKNLIGNGYKISANGLNGRSTSYDGASGGGGGGTIIMHVTNSYSGTLNIEAKGGNGGNTDNDLVSGRCYGAGGGGSGGIIYFNGSLPAVTTNISGGSAGLDIDVNSCNTPAPATAGSNGFLVTNYSYRASTDSSNYCQSLLPVRLISFHAFVFDEQKVLVQWEIANPRDARSFTVQRRNAMNQWVSVKTITADENTHRYQAVDASPLWGENIYRIKMTGKDNSIVYTPQKRIVLKPKISFSVYPNPATHKIMVVGKFESAEKMMLTDISGKILLLQSINPAEALQEISLKNFTAGIYLIRIGNEVVKIIVK